MIVFAGIVPHSPLLVPSIGKEHREKLKGTLTAFEVLSKSLYLSRPDTIVIISPHASMYPDAFSGHMANKYKGCLKEFGDHNTPFEAKADFLLMDHVHRQLREQKIPFTLTSSEELDYGITVPLMLLTPPNQTWKLVPLSVSMLDIRTHILFGKELNPILQEEQGRVAIIASSDLSHHVNNQSTDGEKPEGVLFDRTVRDATTQKNSETLLKLDQATLDAAGQCGMKPIAILLGILEGLNTKTTELCYEAPFGVGQLTVSYELN